MSPVYNVVVMETLYGKANISHACPCDLFGVVLAQHNPLKEFPPRGIFQAQIKVGIIFKEVLKLNYVFMIHRFDDFDFVHKCCLGGCREHFPSNTLYSNFTARSAMRSDIHRSKRTIPNLHDKNNVSYNEIIRAIDVTQ